jgi:DNA-binding NarL/FixJ family response regulator
MLVDDHAMLRSGLRQLVIEQTDLELVGEASNGTKALEVAAEVSPDIILMDIHLPDISGIEVSRQIMARKTGAKIIIFSSNVSRTVLDEALSAGASGYVSKSGAADELIHAITAVLSGKLYISPEVSADILQAYRKSLSAEPEPDKPVLSDRDRELMRLVAEGQRNKEIATHLKISIKSVEASRSRLMKKLGCASSAELVRYAIREGIAKP